MAEQGVALESAPAHLDGRDAARARLGRLLWMIPPLVAGVVAFALARATLLPGVAFWDTAEFQTVAPVLGTAHPTGFPSYVLLGWLASVVLQPFGEPAFRMNLLSAVLGAATAAVTAILVARLTGRSWLGLASGIVLASTPIVWQISNHADPHAFHLTLVALLLLFLVAWQQERRPGEASNRWLVAASITFGVAIANHSLTLLLAPGIGLYVLAVDRHLWRRGRLIALCALAVLGTAGLFYLELPLRAGLFRAPLVYGTPQTWDGFWYIALAEQFRGSLVDPLGHLVDKAGTVARIAGEQLGWLASVVPIALLATAWRQPRYALLTGMSAVITCWFAASYVNADIDRYYLGPALMALTWLAILADTVLRALAEATTRLRTRLSYGRRSWAGLLGALLAEGALAVLLVAPSVSALPERRPAVDLSQDTLAARWLDTVLAQIAPNAVVISWWSYSTPLWYAQQVEGRRPDMVIIDDRTRLDEGLGEISDVIESSLPTRPVYLIRPPAELALLKTRYRVEAIAAPTDNPVVRVLGPVQP